MTLSNGMMQSAKIQSELFETMKVQDQSLPCRLQLPVGTIMLAPNSEISTFDKQTFNIRSLRCKKFMKIYIKR